MTRPSLAGIEQRTAAASHLTAQPAPEASREDALRVALDAYQAEMERASRSLSLGAPIALLAGSALANAVEAVITERGETWIIDDAAFEEAARSEHHAEGLLAHLDLTEYIDLTEGDPT